MAMKTISAHGTLNAGMAIEVQCGNHRLIMDQPKSAAGQDLGPTPLEAILAAVAGCFGTIGRFIAHQQKIELRGMRFEIEADYDPAGLLGRDPAVRPGFSGVAHQGGHRRRSGSGRQAGIAGADRAALPGSQQSHPRHSSGQRPALKQPETKTARHLTGRSYIAARDQADSSTSSLFRRCT